MPASDESLLLRDLRSDRGEDAARALYRTYSGELYGFALNRLGDRGLAEEVVQDVFMRVWRHAAEYDAGRGSVRTWLYGICRNAIVDLERHRARRPPLAAREPEGEEAVARRADRARAAALAGPGRARAPDARAPRGRAPRPPRRPERQGDRRSCSGCPPGTVKSRTYYALQNMRLALDEMEAL